MRLYVIGPVTGREDLNREAFEDAREMLEQAGYDVTIPHDIILPDASHERAMQMSIGWIATARGGVAMLDDWDDSPGARLEYSVATDCGIEAHCVGAWLLMAGVYPDDDSSPEDTPNLPSDGARTPSDEALSALTRRMDETNALLRAVYNQISALTAIVVGEMTKSTCDYPKQAAREALDKAKDISRSAQKCFESAGKESQDDRKA